jgi:hypothetical protein
LPQRITTLTTPSVADLAGEPGIHDACQSLAGFKKWTTQRHLELARIPAPTFQEQQRAEWMVTQFRDLGCAARMDRARNVVAFPGAARTDGVRSPRTSTRCWSAVGRRDPLHADASSKARRVDNGAGLAALLAVARARNSAALLASRSHWC